MKRPDFTQEQIDYLIGILRLPCCHVTGMHDPTHYEERRYVCDFQKATAWERAVSVLGLAERYNSEHCGTSVRNIDHRLGPWPEDDCYWCNKYGATKRRGPQPIREKLATKAGDEK